jgi:arylsulfatase A-like enzyme
MISWPRHFTTDVVSDALVELMDLTPTLYDLLGMEIPNYVQGRSLLPVLTGESERHREFVRSEFYGAIDYPDQTHATMYRDRRWKLVCYHGKGICELYDLENDPWEHRDLSGDPEFHDVLTDLVQKSMDATVYSYARGPERINPF